jgi:hypothetical protein
MAALNEEIHSNPESWKTEISYLRRNYIALGALLSSATVNLSYGSLWLDDWRELNSISILAETPGHYVTGEVRLENCMQRLLLAGRVRIFAKVLETVAIHRVYVRASDASSRQAAASGGLVALKSTQGDQIERILPYLSTSHEVWTGNSKIAGTSFDPFATTEDGSLFYIFNTLPSPAPDPNVINDLTVREAIEDLLDYTTPLPGLKTQLYPYQARSAAQMIQHESCITGRVDPRFETRVDMNGAPYYYSPRNMIFRKSAPMYDSTRGGILAESMGLGYVQRLLMSKLTWHTARPSSVWR